MSHAARDEAFLSCTHWLTLFSSIRCIRDQRVTARNHNHVFIEIVHMRRGRRRLAARLERHLAAFRSIEYIAFDAGSGLAAGGDSVRRALHELWELFHTPPPAFFLSSELKY